MSRYGVEAESLTLSCLSVLEQLQPVERSVFLLHDIFGRSHAETARRVGLTESACRQLLLGVRRALRDAKRELDAQRRASAEIEAQFRAAVRAADVERLSTLLAPDVAGWDTAAALPQPDRILSVEVADGLVQAVRLA